MSGWIKTYRSLADHWLAEQPEKLGWWVLLLLKVSHEDKKILMGNQLVELKRGQINISFSSLAELWKTSRASAERFVEILEQEQMISREVRRKVSIITICNYESYQDKKRGKRDDDEPIVIRSRDTIKEDKEDKEIYIDLTNAPASRTREENPAWDEARESGFVERFKAQGSARLIMRTTGKSPEDVMRLLDVYLASRQMKDLGHKDFNHFLEAFQYAIKNNKISIPVTPAQSKEKKVISGADIFKVYGE
jgi:hypothetical protein